MDIEEIIKKIQLVGRSLKSTLASPVPTTTDADGSMASINGARTNLEEAWKEFNTLEKDKKLSDADIKKFHDAYGDMLEGFQKEASKYPDKLKYLKNHIGDFAELHKNDMKGIGGKLNTFFKSLETDGQSELEKRWAAKKKEGQKDAHENLTVPAEPAGKELRTTISGWWHSIGGMFDDAVDAGKNVVNDAQNAISGNGANAAGAGTGTAGTGTGATTPTADANKKPGMFDNFPGKEIAGGAIGGIAGFMIGKVFGNGWVGTIIGAMLAIGGAIMGRDFAIKHFGDSSDKAAAGATSTGAGQNVAANNPGGAGSKTAGAPPRGVGMTDDQLQAALDKYNDRVKFKPFQATEEEVQERIMRPIAGAKRKSNDPLYPS